MRVTRLSMAAASSARYLPVSGSPVARDLGGPRLAGLRDGVADRAADAGVDDAGDVPGAAQRAAGDGGAQDVVGVQAGGFGFAEGAPEPGAGGVGQGCLGVGGGQVLAEQPGVTGRPARGGSGRARWSRGLRGGRRWIVRCGVSRWRTGRRRRGRSCRRARRPGAGVSRLVPGAGSSGSGWARPARWAAMRRARPSSGAGREPGSGSAVRGPVTQ